MALVVPASQAKSYLAMPNRGSIPVLACPVNGIAKTRQWIGQQAGPKFLMLDDDLRFFYRPAIRPASDPLPGAGLPNIAPPRLYRSEPEHITQTFACIDKALDIYAHAAISARDGNNTLPYPVALCRRPLRALAYQRKHFLACEHGRVDVMEDFDITLQLLRRGFQNYVTTAYSQDQYKTQLPGGVSDYRTHELHEASVRKMAEMHSEFITLKWKENLHGGEFGRRLEAIIYWQKAWKSSLKELGL